MTRKRQGCRNGEEFEMSLGEEPCASEQSEIPGGSPPKVAGPVPELWHMRKNLQGLRGKKTPHLRGLLDEYLWNGRVAVKEVD